MSDEVVHQTPPNAVDGVDDSKKKSQYYYWHSHEKERAKLGDVAPKTSPALVKSEAVEASPLLHQVALTKYSWCNNTNSVSVYVDFDGLSADNTKVEFSTKKLKVQVHPVSTGTAHVLQLNLAKEINHETSSFRFKPNQLVVKLVKKDDGTWHDLVDDKAASNDE
ncbi:Hypothetical protein, putative [Bodo saltans]|uniref:ACD-like protein n=1 Tax=Bodo saltans TaxID=75058 RepID=A0A0S4KMW7_BODSA|eukprot:CUI14225.1 Hypothetical protein, putative [Bodo saltans]